MSDERPTREQDEPADDGRVEHAAPAGDGARADAEGAAAAASKEDAAPATARRRGRRRRWARRLAIAAVLLVAAWAALGFLGVPALVQHVAVPRISDRLTGELRMDAMHFNPFTLGTVIERVTVTDAAGDRVLGFERLEGNLSLIASIVRPGWRLERVRLVDPSAEIVVAEDGSLNLAGLVRPSARPDPDDEAPPEIPHIVVAHLEITGADLGFRDRAISPPVEKRLEDLDLAVTRLDTAPEHDNPHAIEASIGDDGRLTWEGTVHLDPLTAIGTVTLENVALEAFGPYARRTSGVTLDRGRLDLEVAYTVAPARADDRLRVELRRAAIRELDARAGDRPLVAAAALSVDDVVADLDDSRITVAAVTVDGLDAVVHRGADGRLELLEALPATGGDAEGSAASAAQTNGDEDADADPGDGSAARRDLDAIERRIPRLLAALQYLAEDVAAAWTVQVEAVRVADTAVRVEDASVDPPVSASLTAIDLEAGPMASPEGFRTPLRLTATGPGDATLELDGEIDPEEGALGLQVAVAGLPAEPFAGYLPRPLPGPLAGAELTRARIAVDGRLDAELVADVVDATWDGRLDVTELATTRPDGDPPLGLDALGLAGRLETRGPRGEDGPSGSWDGTVDLSGLAARMDVAGEPNSVALGRGGLAGTVSFAMPAAGPEATWNGRLTLEDADAELAGGLPSQARLDVGRLENARLAWSDDRGTLDAELLELEGPDVAAVLAAAREGDDDDASPDGDGTPTEIEDAGAGDAGSPDDAADDDRDDAPDDAPDDGPDGDSDDRSAPLVVRLERLEIRGGAFDLEDRGTDPALAISGSRLELTADRIDTAGGTPATVDLRTALADVGSVTVRGDLDPFRPMPFVDLTVDVADVPLAPLSPAAVPRLGYRIDRGRLGVSTPLRLEEGRIDAPVDLRLSGFHLGERVAGTSTPGVPIKLGLDLLRDGDDVIRATFTVRGDTTSPRFDVTDAIFSGVFTVVGNVASAPFRLLGDLVGAGEDEDLSRVRFRPGTAEPDAGQSRRLDLLAEALEDRPGLRLAITGLTGPADVEALREAELESLLRDRRTSLREAGEDAGVEAALRALLAQRRPTAVGPLVPVPPGRRDQPRPSEDELRTLVLETIEVPESALADLADRRAERVSTFLVDTGGIDEERLRVVPREDLGPDRTDEPAPIAAFDLAPGD